jgi:hypothetical protein
MDQIGEIDLIHQIDKKGRAKPANFDGDEFFLDSKKVTG